MSTSSALTTSIPQENGGATGSNSSTKQEEIDINLEDPQVHDAAKKIQNVFRGKRLGAKAATPVLASEEKQ